MQVTLISAPAGYGKTTLPAQWVAETRLPVAWLSLDPGDDDLFGFLAALLRALQRLDPAFGVTTRALSAAVRSTPGLEARVWPLVGALVDDVVEALPAAFVLVLDDLHLLAAPTVYLALDYLLERLPPAMHVIIARRHDPPLALARLHAHGQLAELRLPALRFTPAEAAAFLANQSLTLDEGELQILRALTEGWPTRLHLAALSLSQPPHAVGHQAFLARLAESERHVFDFLAIVVHLNAAQPFSGTLYWAIHDVAGRLLDVNHTPLNLAAGAYQIEVASDTEGWKPGPKQIVAFLAADAGNGEETAVAAGHALFTVAGRSLALATDKTAYGAADAAAVLTAVVRDQTGATVAGQAANLTARLDGAPLTLAWQGNGVYTAGLNLGQPDGRPALHFGDAGRPRRGTRLHRGPPAAHPHRDRPGHRLHANLHRDAGGRRRPERRGPLRHPVSRGRGRRVDRLAYAHGRQPGRPGAGLRPDRAGCPPAWPDGLLPHAGGGPGRQLGGRAHCA